jgi:hypothetical protein
MTFRKNGIVVIVDEPDQECQFCGHETDTRPYGPGGKRICFACMNSTPKLRREAKRRFKALLNGTKP